jgi:hypothetical protein
MTPVPQPSVTFVTEAPTLTGIDPFVPGSMLLTYPRSKTRDANVGSPRSNRVFGYRWLVQGAASDIPPRREQGSEGTRSLLSSRLQREHEVAAPIPARPPADLWLGHRKSSLVRAASNDHPRATTRCRRCLAPLLPDSLHAVRIAHRVRNADGRRGHATPLVVAHGARRMWRHPANSIVTMFDRRTLDTSVSAKNHPHRQPEVPSIESPDVMRARPARDRPSCERPRATNRLGFVPACPGCLFDPEDRLPDAARRPRSSVGGGHLPFTRPQHPRDSTSAM